MGCDGLVDYINRVLMILQTYGYFSNPPSLGDHNTLEYGLPGRYADDVSLHVARPDGTRDACAVVGRHMNTVP